MFMKRVWVPIFALLLAAGVLTGCSLPAKDESTCRVMYVPFGQDSYVMVEQGGNHVFTATMPDQIYDASGKKIAANQLQKGNILEVTGDGVMLETFPEQYPGVTKIRVLEEGTPQNADQYQELIDSIYVEPDPSVPPSLQVISQTELVSRCTNVTRGGYHWSWMVNEATGEKQSAIACGSHILAWESISEVSMEKPDRLTLSFSKEPESVTAERWPGSRRETPESSGDSEAVEVTNQEGEWTIAAEPGYIYSVYGTWEDGNAEYGFITSQGK